MVRDIRAIARLKRTGEISNLLILVGGLILAGVISFFLRDEISSAEEVTDIIAGVVCGIFVLVTLFIKVFFMADEIPKALSFGMTRHKLFVYSRLVDLLEVAVIALLAFFLQNFVDGRSIFRIAILYYGVIMWMEGLAGNNVIRYGKIAYWIYYIFFLAFFMGFPKVINAVPAVADAVEKFAKFLSSPASNLMYLWSGIILFVFLGIAVNWLSFRRLAVNFVV